MVQLLVAFVGGAYTLFQRIMPTNILIRATHTRRGLRWGVPAMLLAGVYSVVAAALAQWVADGGPGWINLLVLICIWNALKFLANGPVTLVRLMRVRALERRHRDAGVTSDATIPVG